MAAGGASAAIDAGGRGDAAPGFRERAEEIAVLMRRRLDELASRLPLVGEVRGLGPMLAVELVELSPDVARAVTAAALERGLIVVSCGLYGNVLRLLPPLTASDEELERGLDLLAEALQSAR